MAIAQHYGLPTRFIDFTTEPRVAAFFASDIRSDSQPPEEAAILCLDSKDFESIWGIIGDELNLPPEDRPQIITIDVANLWRLEAQAGRFMWSAINEVEDIYTGISRIIFPFSQNDSALPKREFIYPLNQSRLEVALQNFFQNEEIHEFLESMNQAKGRGEIVEITMPTPNYEMSSWWDGFFTADPEWPQVENWEQVKVERFESVYPCLSISVNLSLSFENFASEFTRTLSDELIASNRGRGIEFLGLGTLKKESTQRRLISCITRLWNGMRILPYTASEIRTAMVLCIGIFLDRVKFGDGHEPFRGNSIKISVAASCSGKGAYSYAHVSREGLLRAASPEFVRAVKAHTSLSDEGLSWKVASVGARPWQRFTFSGLRELMVNEIIPTQVAEHGDQEGDDGLAQPLFFSPTSFKVFGIA